jgi:hypothetical protein
MTTARRKPLPPARHILTLYSTVLTNLTKTVTPLSSVPARHCGYYTYHQVHLDRSKDMEILRNVVPVVRVEIIYVEGSQ